MSTENSLRELTTSSFDECIGEVNNRIERAIGSLRRLLTLVHRHNDFIFGPTPEDQSKEAQPAHHLLGRLDELERTVNSLTAAIDRWSH